MELALLGGLMYLGNKINFKQEDSDEISDHKVKLMYNNSEEEIIKKKEEDLSKLVEKSKDPIKNNIINNSINSVNNISFLVPVIVNTGVVPEALTIKLSPTFTCSLVVSTTITSVPSFFSTKNAEVELPESDFT